MVYVPNYLRKEFTPAKLSVIAKSIAPLITSDLMGLVYWMLPRSGRIEHRLWVKIRRPRYRPHC